jgi:hypothetical protein
MNRVSTKEMLGQYLSILFSPEGEKVEIKEFHLFIDYNPVFL